MKSWWDLGEGYGQIGNAFSVHQITCPFCLERGNFALEHRSEKKKANSEKTLYFDTYRCCNCNGFVQSLWSASESPGSKSLYDYRVQPWPIGKPEPSEHWPESVSRFWVQAHDSETNKNLDAANLMARSALQATLRDKAAIGNNLKEEINDLANKGLLPTIMKEWADEVRLLANESAHPKSTSEVPDKKDVRDVLNFLDNLLVYLYDLPHGIEEFRKRK